jgi:DNA-binding MarR family transcriptional regulator
VEDNRRQELTERLNYSAEKLNRQLHTEHLDWLESLDISIPHVRALLLLEQDGPMRMGSIALCLGRAVSATTVVIDRLVKKGFVDRVADPDDRRVVLCQLTDEGEKAIGQFWRIGRERFDIMVSNLDDAQLEKVVAGLELIHWAEKEAAK